MRAGVPVFPTVAVLLLAAATANAQTLIAVPPPDLGALCDDLDVGSLVDSLERIANSVTIRRDVIQIAEHQLTYHDYAEKTLRPLAELARRGSKIFCADLPKRFAFYRNGNVGAGRFTAYHNPIVKGSRTRHGPYLYPLYRRPDGDLSHLTTAEIIAGALDHKNYELVYLTDPTEVNAVQVEGSAAIVLDDGSSMVVTSSGHNGHPYQNVSKLLVADHKIPKDQVTPLGMTRARKYFQEHLDEFWKYWAKNPHYVFFKERSCKATATGKFGPLTPGRSVAIDPHFIPIGSAVWIRSDKPAIADGKVQSWVSFGRVAVSDDTGSGIEGPGRVDVFFGTGEYAQAAAAVTSRPGEIYVLLAK